MTAASLAGHEVNRVLSLDRASFLERFGFHGKPVVVTNITTGWKAMERWTPEFFRDELGETMVSARRTRDLSDKRRMKLSEYIDYVERESVYDDDPYYLVDWIIARDHPELCNDYFVPSYFDSWLARLPAAVRPELRWLYIGPARSGSRMHVDTMMTSAWNAVVCGQKRWVFYPPDQGENLYFGEVDAFKPDFAKFPLFAKACAPLVCTQRPGEVVFTPGGWWHQVVNDETTISVTENFVNESNVGVARDAIRAALGDFPFLRFHIPELFVSKE